MKKTKSQVKSKKAFAIKLVVILLLLVAAVFLGIYCVKQFEAKKYKGDGGEQSQAIKDTMVLDGVTYHYNYDMKHILFMGIDNNSAITELEYPGGAGQADSILILSIDKEKKEAKILSISRDSMTEVDVFDRSGEYTFPIEAQLATQYAYGQGGKASSRAMVKTVSELLYDLPISGYLTLDVAGISVMNDYVGGVEITVPEDYTYIDEAFAAGATLTLTGSQAEKYVRYRDIAVEGSNNMRMRRQVQYIPVLLDRFHECLDGDEKGAEDFYSVIRPYMVTDLTVEELEELTEYDWEVENVSYVPGETKTGEKHEEFYVDEKELQKLIINLFYSR